MHAEKSSDEKSPVNLRIRTALKEEARHLGLNLSRALEESLEREIGRRKREAWQNDNREAIAAYNQRIEECGPALSAYRSF